MERPLSDLDHEAYEKSLEAPRGGLKDKIGPIPKNTRPPPFMEIGSKSFFAPMSKYRHEY